MSYSESVDGLPIAVSVDGEHLVVALRGEIDIANAQALPAVIAAAANGDTSVRIDLAGVTFLDSSCLRAILVCRQNLASDGVDVKVRNLTPQARNVFEITNLTHLIDDRTTPP